MFKNISLEKRFWLFMLLVLLVMVGIGLSGDGTHPFGRFDV